MQQDKLFNGTCNKSAPKLYGYKTDAAHLAQVHVRHEQQCTKLLTIELEIGP